MLIKSNFPLDEVNYKNYTACAIAAKKGFISIVKALRKAGADINLTD